jgi:hypothetical protein
MLTYYVHVLTSILYTFITIPSLRQDPINTSPHRFITQPHKVRKSSNTSPNMTVQLHTVLTQSILFSNFLRLAAMQCK